MSQSRERDSEGSDDDAAARKRRSTRACDQCRKTKSKCERLSETQCANCAAFGQVCTFVGPSYKRGPPKGYIHAIEQRMQHYEALIGVIMSTSDTRAQSLISDLRQDELARGILNRVDAGRFGPAGRGFQMNGTQRAPTKEVRSSRRQSRVTREYVSNEDGAVLQPPTTEWQDRLCNRLVSGRSAITGPSRSNSTSVSSPGTDVSDHLSQRRRLDNDFMGFNTEKPNWDGMGMYTMDGSSSDDRGTDDGAAAFGQLSLDEHKEIRFHGKVSGLHLLGRSERTDHRNEGGVWHLPMARHWPMAKDDVAQLVQEKPEDVKMPPMDLQEHLVDLYFTYMHPIFPVIHKEQFLLEWATMKNGQPQHNDTKPIQNVSKLLLLSMFTIAARYLEDDQVPNNGKMWESGCNYLADARRLMNKVFHSSRPSTIQALLLLGVREFGIGSMEHGWIYLAMARAMATDLGLHRSADKWSCGGRELFGPIEKQVRKRIWWACYITDKVYGIYMGRPASVRDGDFDTAFPEIDQTEEEEMWPPSTHPEIEHAPAPAIIMSCFRAWASLSVIVGTVMDKIYPVRVTSRVPRRTWLLQIESQLDQWYLALPDCLRYATAMKRVIPPPNVLRLHISYWSTVLLLHRAFIPNWKRAPGVGDATADTTALKSFDLCQNAASRVSSIVTAFREKFGLRRTSPFLTPSLLCAGIMHVVTLSLRPSNVQATIGLQQCLEALKEMEIPWPAAKRSYDLLHGVKLQIDNPQTYATGTRGRNKRPLPDAFDKERISDVLQREAFGPPNNESKVTSELGQSVGVQDLSEQLMAHILGMDVTGVTESTSYFPGYRWWPKNTPGEPGGAAPDQPGSHQQHIQQSPVESPDAWPMEAFGMEPTPNFNYEPQLMGGYQQYGPPGDTAQNGLFYNPLQDML